MATNPYKQMLKKIKNIEKNGQSLKDFVVKSTCGDVKHKMNNEQDYLAQDMRDVYEDVRPLEVADLYDYQNLIGRYDGKL